MTDPRPPDFYVGWAERQPARLSRWSRRLAVGSLAVALAGSAAVALGQRPLEGGRFEYGSPEEYAGFLVADPFPALLIPGGGETDRFHLVAQGKHGADPLVAPWLGQWVTLTGILIHRGEQRMIEVVQGSLHASPDQPPSPELGAIEDLGVRYVEGEVVDSKCHLGVMTPGSGIVHRACADLCLRGGIPPMLAVTGPGGAKQALVMVGIDGSPIEPAALEPLAEAVGVTGRVVRVGGTTFIHADPLLIRRLD